MVAKMETGVTMLFKAMFLHGTFTLSAGTYAQKQYC